MRDVNSTFQLVFFFCARLQACGSRCKRRFALIRLKYSPCVECAHGFRTNSCKFMLKRSRIREARQRNKICNVNTYTHTARKKKFTQSANKTYSKHKENVPSRRHYIQSVMRSQFVLRWIFLCFSVYSRCVKWPACGLKNSRWKNKNK